MPLSIGIAAFALGAALASVGWYLVIRGRYRVRAQRSQRQVMEVSELAGGLAHELRNPLSTMVLNLELLAEEFRNAHELDADTRRRGLTKIDAIRQQADRLQSIFDDFLRLIGPYKLQTTRVDMNEVVQRLIEFFGPQAVNAGIDVRTQFHPEPLLCELDVRLMEQALLNLLINAQEAMPNGGDLLISTSSADGRAVIEVTDTGIGIPAANRDKIFRPFFSTKPAGTGLGLSTTQRVITEHAGSIEVEAGPRAGAKFTIRLPLIQSPGAPE
ncbi:MAG TPA: ATP-binding protein [Phycisphaerae bacterium]|jgi:signal transduction histidine kinase